LTDIDIKNPIMPLFLLFVKRSMMSVVTEKRSDSGLISVLLELPGENEI